MEYKYYNDHWLTKGLYFQYFHILKLWCQAQYLSTYVKISYWFLFKRNIWNEKTPKQICVSRMNDMRILDEVLIIMSTFILTILILLLDLWWTVNTHTQISIIKDTMYSGLGLVIQMLAAGLSIKYIFNKSLKTRYKAKQDIHKYEKEKKLLFDKITSSLVLAMSISILLGVYLCFILVMFILNLL
jgi:hypothetical protein